MSNEEQQEWEFIPEYPQSEELRYIEIQKKLDSLSTRLEKMDAQLEKLTQSQRSLIEYFSSLNKRDVRDLNFNIRNFRANKAPPTNFVASKTQRPSIP